MTETKFKKGDLVWIWTSIVPEEKSLGIVMEIRPHVLGGTGVMSWRGGGWKISYDEKRSEYLVVSPTGEFQSWFDEKNLHSCQDEQGAGEM